MSIRDHARFPLKVIKADQCSEAEVGIGFCGIGYEQLLSIFIDAEFANNVLRGRIGDPLCKSHRSHIIDFGPFIGVDGDDVIDVQQACIFFH